MSTSLSTETRLIDNAFTETWYDIRPEAVDNILLATVITALLKERGRFTPQTGSNLIERTIKYAVGNSTTAVSKGDTLAMGTTETETAAFWTFRNNATPVQRDTITDVENAGSFKIKDYIKKRLKEARDSATQKMETDVMRAEVTDETGKEMQSLCDILPLYANATAGTYGRIARPSAYSQIAAGNGVYKPTVTGSNPWWGPAYKQMVAPYELNLVNDMKVLFNSVYNNQEAPNLLVCDQATFELYEEFALDKSQLVKDESSRLADLGFDTLRFKGKPMIWTPNAYYAGASSGNCVRMYNTDYIEFVYSPQLWFELSEWKSIPNQMERVAHLLSRGNIISDQLRRHGMLTSAAVA